MFKKYQLLFTTKCLGYQVFDFCNQNGGTDYVVDIEVHVFLEDCLWPKY